MAKMPHKPASPPKHGAPVGTKMTNRTKPIYSAGPKPPRDEID